MVKLDHDRESFNNDWKMVLENAFFHSNDVKEEANFIYISRHGESINNLLGKIGGDSSLSPRGVQYASALGTFFNNLGLRNLQVFTSELQRTKQTAFHIEGHKVVKKEINEIDAGVHDGLTYEDIAEEYPIEFAKRDRDKLGYRYPEGESYVDVVERLKPLIKEIEMKEADENILVVSHQATLRCLLAHFQGTPLQEAPYTKVPLHTIMKICINKVCPPSYYRLPVDCVDTFRSKPNNCHNGRSRDEALKTVPFHI